MQERIALYIGLYQFSSVREFSVAAIFFVAPAGLLIFAFRRFLAAVLRDRSRNWNWRRLRWVTPSVTLCLAALASYIGQRFELMNPVSIALFILADLPGVFLASIAGTLILATNLGDSIAIAMIAAAHWLGWYALLVWMESIATKPISLRDEIDRA